MRTDPRTACENETELLGWAIVHDLIAHPLMALTGYSRLSLRFHDWTSRKSWPRVVPEIAHKIFVWSEFGILSVTRLSSGFYSIDHPKVTHRFVTNADDAVAAVEKAESWFQTLADEFGGAFSNPERSNHV